MTRLKWLMGALGYVVGLLMQLYAFNSWIWQISGLFKHNPHNPWAYRFPIGDYLITGAWFQVLLVGLLIVGGALVFWSRSLMRRSTTPPSP